MCEGVRKWRIKERIKEERKAGRKKEDGEK